MRDDDDRRLAQRLREYEQRLPAADAPDIAAASRGRSAWPAAVAAGLAAIVAGLLLAAVLTSRAGPLVGEATSPVAEASSTTEATSSARDESSERPSATASASPRATPSMSPSAPASTPPSASPTPQVGSSARDTIWRVLVSDLVVRSEPGVEDPNTILSEGLTEEDRVLVVDGPVASGGYEWYQVLPIRPDGLRERPFGWVASASREGEPWLAMENLSCPEPPDLEGLLRLAPEERLACYGGRTIEFRAEQAQGGCGVAGGVPVSYEPRWLMSEGGCGFGPPPGQTTSEAWLMLRFPPGVPNDFGVSPVVDVVGHFDDPAAQTCVATANYPDVTPPTKAEAVAQCRTQFVVESLTRVP